VHSSIGEANGWVVGASIRQGAFATLHIEQPPGIGQEWSPLGQHGPLGLEGQSGRSEHGFEDRCSASVLPGFPRLSQCLQLDGLASFVEVESIAAGFA